MFFKLVPLVILIALLGCGSDEDIQHYGQQISNYPGAPTITIKKTSLQRSKEGFVLKYRLESNQAVPYGINVLMEKEGTCTVQGKEHEWYDGSDHWISMKAGTFVKQRSLTKSSAWCSYRIDGIDYNKETSRLKTLTLVLVPWENTGSRTGDDPYNLGIPFHLTTRL